MAYFGGIFFANMGGGGGQNYFHKTPKLRKVSKKSPKRSLGPPPPQPQTPPKNSRKSGKEKAHKHKQFCPVTAWVRGGVYRPGGQGSNVYVLCAEPKQHKHFRLGTRPGGLVTGVMFMCQMFRCLSGP